MNIDQVLAEHETKWSIYSKKISMVNDLAIDLEHIKNIAPQVINYQNTNQPMTSEIATACGILKLHCNRAEERIKELMGLIPVFEHLIKETK